MTGRAPKCSSACSSTGVEGCRMWYSKQQANAVQRPHPGAATCACASPHHTQLHTPAPAARPSLTPRTDTVRGRFAAGMLERIVAWRGCSRIIVGYSCGLEATPGSRLEWSTQVGAGRRMLQVQLSLVVNVVASGRVLGVQAADWRSPCCRHSHRRPLAAVCCTGRAVWDCLRLAAAAAPVHGCQAAV